MASADRARDYSRQKDRLALLGGALGLLAVAAFIFLGGARRFNQRLLPGTHHGPRQRVRYALVTSLLSWLAGLPLGFYNGYIIERRFGLSKQTSTSWAVDHLKSKAISLPLELAVLEGLYAAIRRWPRRWWLVCAGAIVPLSALFAQLFPILVAPRFNRYEPLRDRELAERLRALTARAGVPVAGVMQMDMSRRTSKANAFFAGLGPTKRIVLADTLLETFTPEEIEGVVAHEAGHQVHRDIWRFVALSGVFTLAVAWFTHLTARRLLRSQPRLSGTADLADLRSLPVLALTFGVAGTLLAPLQLAYSRYIERKADRYAVALTGQPAAYAGAMRKLALANLADPDPPRWITLLLHSHPPLGERIATAERDEQAHLRARNRNL
jgi:STE24 endopeptidase